MEGQRDAAVPLRVPGTVCPFHTAGYRGTSLIRNCPPPRATVGFLAHKRLLPLRATVGPDHESRKHLWRVLRVPGIVKWREVSPFHTAGYSGTEGSLWTTSWCEPTLSSK